MNENVTKLLKEQIWYLGTYSDEPNAVPVAFKDITEDGKLKAIASCDNEINFYVDAETGKLYQKYIEDKNNSKVYAINDDDLIATDSSVEDSD